jgi:hypothetical protein
LSTIVPKTTVRMTAVEISWDEFAAWDTEPVWTRAEFETLTAEQAEALLLRRLDKLCRRGIDPVAALHLAVHVELPFP